MLVIDDTAMPKKGDRSVGVAPQYASSLGKTANCQTLVSLTLAQSEVPVMVALRLFIPESWTNDPVRLKRAGVPVEHRAARTKPEIALAEIDRVIAAGVRFDCVLADAGYGLSAPFRQGLTTRGLVWAVCFPGFFHRGDLCWHAVTQLPNTVSLDPGPLTCRTICVGLSRNCRTRVAQRSRAVRPSPWRGARGLRSGEAGSRSSNPDPSSWPRSATAPLRRPVSCPDR